MDKEELRNILVREQIKDQYYDLDAIDKDEALVLMSENGKWCVYYSERGQQSHKICYASEDEACRRFLDSLMRDPSARRSYIPPAPFTPLDSV
jgi:hypothetical protein